ncbi:MAG: hypothetical protein JW709_00380 [Sedimentisphaerales bacterium]|nr:hypothetical protein [Sedimentisphaerales bacterium]
MTTPYHYPDLRGYRDLTDDQRRSWCQKHKLKHTGILDIFHIKALEVDGLLCAIIPAWNTAAPRQLKCPVAWAYAPIYGDEINLRRLPLLPYSQPGLVGLGQLAGDGCSQKIIVTQGILDSLRAVSGGFTAICPTEEKAFWHCGLDRFIREKTVYIIADRDETGERFNRDWSKTLAQAGAEKVFMARLPYPVQFENGKTLGDFLDEGGDIHLLLDKAAPYEPDSSPIPETPDYRTIVDDTLPQTLAQTFVELSPARYYYYRGQWVKFEQGRYELIDTDALRRDYGAIQMRLWLRRLQRKAMIYERIAVTRRRTIDALLCLASLPGVAVAERDQAPPFWLDADLFQPDPRQVIILQDGLLAVTPTDIEYIPPTGNLFALRSLPVSYDPDAVCPVWETTIKALCQESVPVLQEFMGSLLTSRNRFPKLLLLIGSSPGDKEILGTAIHTLVGHAHCTTVPLASLSTQKGVRRLEGKTVALINDTNLPASRAARRRVLDYLDTISGQVSDRPHVRLVFRLESLRQLDDDLSSLAERFVFVHLSPDSEGGDIDVPQELPGILNWSLQGLQRLFDRGAFTETAAAMKMRRWLQERQRPMQAFVRQCCKLGAQEKVKMLDLQRAYRLWCRRHGHQAVSRKRFRRELKGICGNIRFQRFIYPDKHNLTTAVGIALVNQ